MKFTDKELKELHEKGYKDHEIANILNVSITAVKYRRKALGLKNNNDFYLGKVTFDKEIKEKEIKEKIICKSLQIDNRLKVDGVIVLDTDIRPDLGKLMRYISLENILKYDNEGWFSNVIPPSRKIELKCTEKLLEGDIKEGLYALLHLTSERSEIYKKEFDRRVTFKKIGRKKLLSIKEYLRPPKDEKPYSIAKIQCSIFPSVLEFPLDLVIE